MKSSSKVAENLQKLEEIKAKNPTTTHIYMRRIGKDDLVIDIPIAQAVGTIRLRTLWEVVSSNKQMDDEVEKLFRDDEEIDIPPKPSEIKIAPPLEEVKRKRGRPRKT